MQIPDDVKSYFYQFTPVERTVSLPGGIVILGIDYSKDYLEELLLKQLTGPFGRPMPYPSIALTEFK